MDYAHEAYVSKLAPDLKNLDNIEQLFEWLTPEPGKIKTTGNVIVVEALINHWLNETPPESLRQYITEKLTSSLRRSENTPGALEFGSAKIQRCNF